MKKIVGNRRTGKTSELILEASRNGGGLLLVRDHRSIKYAKELIVKLRCSHNVFLVVSYKEYETIKDDELEAARKGVYIDEVDQFIKFVMSHYGNPVKGITLNC